MQNDNEISEQLLNDIEPIFDKIKLAVLGKGVVGKSSLVYRFINKENPEEHDATIEDRYNTVELINGVNTTIEILDTAGEDDYQNLLEMWINYAEGFILTYAIDDKESFKALKDKYDRIIKLKGNSCPIVLVGNKIDLENNREVDQSEARELAELWNVEYIETSALKEINCRAPFLTVAQLIINAKKKAKELEEKSNESKSKNERWSCPCTFAQKCGIF